MLPSVYKPEIAPDRSWVSVPLATGSSRFHALWLRDNACAAAPTPRTSTQKIESVLDLPAAPVIAAATVESDQLSISLSADKTEYRFPLDWLEQHRYDYPIASPGIDQRAGLTPGVTRWDQTLSASVPTADYATIRGSKKALLEWLDQIRNLGVARLTGLGATSGEIRDVASLFGYVRHTNYGDVFDVRSEINPANLAFTSLGLQPHTDNPYRDPVPTLQILACLQNSAEGGHSVVVDGFNAATTLFDESQDHFRLLSSHSARFFYGGSGDVHLSSRKPVLELSPENVLTAIRFNNRSMAPLQDIEFDQLEAYYAAYRHLAEIIERDSHQIEFQLKPGELFIVDNTRVLHGRTAYDSGGNRWLQGCYPDKDGLLSTIAVLKNELSGSQEHD